jgi:hypothetical protein
MALIELAGEAWDCFVISFNLARLGEPFGSLRCAANLGLRLIYSGSNIA